MYYCGIEIKMYGRKRYPYQIQEVRNLYWLHVIKTIRLPTIIIGNYSYSLDLILRPTCIVAYTAN